MEIKRTGIALLSFLLLGIPSLAQVVEFNLASQSEAESVGTISVTVQLDTPFGSDIDVSFSVAGSATEGGGNDYTITTSPLTIPMGQSNADITITVNDDSDTESSETVEITLTGTSDGSLGTTTFYTATIEDNDTPPVVIITAPADGTSVDFGTNLTFTGTANDTEEGDLSANLSWSSDLDGNIGNGASFSTTGLTVGTHVITASVTDGGGLPGSDNITVTINNTPPVVIITAPTDGTSVDFGTNLTFTGTANDTEEGDLSANLSWSSDLDGNIGNGASFSTTGLTVGTHVITASVTDGGGLPGSDNITVTINNTPPVVTITAPTDGTSVDFGTNLTFTGTANDTEEGDLSANLSWSSDLDGNIGNGASFSTTGLTVGTHVITASVTDGGGLPGSDNITVTINNTPPVVTITAPTDGTSVDFGTNLTFTGTANDTEEGDLSANLSWSSDLDGNIGNGASFSTTGLTVGTHVITASVTDGGGLPGSDNITVTINNTPPVVTITAPTDGTSVDFGTNLTFTGTANDTEEGDLSANLSWSSDLDGNIGNGASFSTTGLTVGTHVITASVTDGGGLPGSDNITVTINNTSPVVVITSPVDGISVGMGTNIDFVGTADDAEEGDLSASISWDSDLDGSIGNGASFSSTILSVGTHIITATALDGGGLEGNDVIIVEITNTPPTVTITEPVDGTTIEEGINLMFVATAMDTEEGDLSPGLTWIASLDGGIGMGASISTAALSIGTQSITASVFDGGGLEGNDAVTITITAPNAAPAVTIDSPVDGTSVVEGTDLTFTGTATDPEEGDLSANLNWNSDQDGDYGTGASFNFSTLSVGTHIITASVTDNDSETGSANITVTITANNPPVVTISLPTDGLSVVEGTNITFTGSVTDIEDNNATLTNNLSWDSNLDNNIGTGGSFSTTGLSIGVHTITASVTDSNGDPGSDNITVTIMANNPPVVTISAPTDGLSVVEGTDITFTGSVTDIEDNNATLTNNLSWDSNLDNNIGTGGSFSTTGLSIGVHTITASVTDSNGDPGSDNITVTIMANNPPVVTISAPTDGLSVVEGTDITFTGSVTDIDDNNATLTNNLSWENLDNI